MIDDTGYEVLGQVLDAAQRAELIDRYDDDGAFRSTVDMARHRFGEGEYRYFRYPLPPVVQELRSALWPLLLPIARRWSEQLGRPAPWPDSLDEWLARCHDAGQVRPTPLLLRYEAGGWNALHRDLYGDLVFPLQVVVLLDDAFEGGELTLVEQRPRAQSKATVVPLSVGEAVAITTKERPVRSARGWSAAPVRHGVSEVRSGRRHTLGIIFHDAT